MIYSNDSKIINFINVNIDIIQQIIIYFEIKDVAKLAEMPVKIDLQCVDTLLTEHVIAPKRAINTT